MPALPAHSLNLRRRGSLPAWAALLLRLGLALALIAVGVAVNWFDRGGLRDNIDGEITFPEVIYFTIITITTVGYGDIVPVTERARLFDAFALTPIRLFVWLIFLGTAYDFFLRGLLERARMSVLQRNLSGHVIVAGYGVSGGEAVAELMRTGVAPQKIVVIDGEAQALKTAEACGATVLEGDATRDQTLQAARVDRARAVVVSAGRDDTSILIVLTARRLAPKAAISAVIRSEDNEALARQAGADTVINPASFAGLLLASSTHSEHLADYLTDLAGCHGSVALRERAVAADEVGQPLAAVRTGKALQIHRGAQAFGFWEREAERLEPGDLILEVIPRS